MSFAYNPAQPIPTSSSVASAPVNSAFSQVAGAFNSHVAGSLYPHSVTAGAGGINVGASVVGGTAAATGATDLWTMLDRLANAVGIVANGTSGSGVWTSLSNISGSASGVNQATASPTAFALARRDASGGAAFGPLAGNNVVGTGSDSTHSGVYARGASGDPSQLIFQVQNNAGSVNRFSVDNLGNTVNPGTSTSATVIATGIIYAGSGTTQVTDSVGNVRLAALPVVDRAHGGFGLDMTNSANYPTVRSTYGLAQSGANGDITSLTALTTAIGPGAGGTGLVNPAPGSIPVTNGSGNYQLLPPTPANYFVVSNGTTYVAQAFATSMIPSGSLNQSVMSSLFPSAGTGAGNLLKAQAQSWAGFINGTWVQFAGGTGNYSPAIDPSGIGAGQTRIDLLVLNAAGNLAWSVGTPSATPSIAATPLPANAAPIWYVQVAQSATTITGYSFTGSGAAFIQDARNLFGPTTAVAGGGAGQTLSYATMNNDVASLPNSVRIGNKPFVFWGSDSDLSAELDFFAALGGTLPNQSTAINGHAPQDLIVSTSYVRDALGDTTAADVFANFYSPDLIGRIYANGNSFSLRAGATDVALVRNRRITATLTSPITSGASGQRFGFIDLTTAPPTLVLQTSSAPPNANCVPCGIFWWDNASTTLQVGTFIGTKMLQNIGTPNVTPVVLSAASANAQSTTLTNTSAAYQSFSNYSAQFFYVPDDCHALVIMQYYYTAGVFPAGSQVSIATQIANVSGGDGSVNNYAYIYRSNGAEATESGSTMAYARISRGYNAFAIVGYAFGATAAVALYPPSVATLIIFG